MAINKGKLIQAAAKAREGSVSPYFKFKVGAALLTKSGEIIGGANVESASYGLTCCAERIALFKALTDGKKKFYRGRSRGALRWRADAVRRVPSITARICAGRKGVRRGQQKFGSSSGIFRSGVVAIGVHYCFLKLQAIGGE